MMCQHFSGIYSTRSGFRFVTSVGPLNTGVFRIIKSRNIDRAEYNKLKHDSFIKALVDLCITGRLHYYGDINGWSYREDMLNPFPKVKGRYLEEPGIVDLWNPSTLYADSDDCLIHRDNFKAYLRNEKQWPVNGLLANWWKKSEPQTEAMGDIGLGNHTGTETKNDANEKAPRTRIDNLSRAINAAIIAMGKKPSFDELWRYFQDDKDETGFIEDYTDEKITWRDTKGKMKDTQKETLANRLSRVNS